MTVEPGPGDIVSLPSLTKAPFSKPPLTSRFAWAAPAVVPLSAKDAALLAVVALDGPIAADHLAALVWPAAERRKADTNLRQRLFRLRRDVGTSLLAGTALLRLDADVGTDLAPTLA